MRAGAFRNLITIQRKVTVGSTNPNYFEANEVWQNWREDVPADVEVRRGREHFDPQSKQRFSEDVWLFRVRYEEADGLTAGMRIQHGGQQFDIKSQRPDAQFRRQVIIECTVQDAVTGRSPLSAGIFEVISDGTVSDAYPGFTVTAEHGHAPYEYTAAALPPGLAINSGTGAVSGTPTTAGTFTVHVEVRDHEYDCVKLPPFAITIHAAPGP